MSPSSAFYSLLIPIPSYPSPREEESYGRGRRPWETGLVSDQQACHPAGALTRGISGATGPGSALDCCVKSRWLGW